MSEDIVSNNGGGPMAGSHSNLHSERGARAGEHPGRARNPVIKVQDLAWLEFEKPDLAKAERFAHAFGFTPALRTSEELHLRGTDAGSPCVIIRRGSRSRFVRPAFVAADASDLQRLTQAVGARARLLPETLGGTAVDLVDPSGMPVRVVADTDELASLRGQTPHTFTSGTIFNAPTTPSVPPANLHRCSGWATSWCKPRSIWNR